MRAAWLAVGVVVVANAVAIIPAERERADPVGTFTLAVCRDHVVGGWRDDELPMLQLTLDGRMGGLDNIVDDAALAALGFSAEARAMVGDTAHADASWPMSREAWLALRQQPDSFRMLEVQRIAPTRAALAPVPGELAMRGLIGLEWMWEPPREVNPRAATADQPPRRIGVHVVRLLPSRLGLERAQGAMLDALRNDMQRPCGVTVDVTLNMGKDGAVWVSGDPRAASGEQR